MTSEENKRRKELIHLATLSMMSPKEREFYRSMLKLETLVKEDIELEDFNVDFALVLINNTIGMI